MSVLILAVIVLICTILVIWGIDQVPQLTNFSGVLKLLVILIAVLFLLSRSGVV